MSDHLPECPVPEMDGLWGLPMHPEDAKANCICPSLRACEQRVREDERAAVLTEVHKWVMRLPYEIDGEIWIDRDDVEAIIERLRTSGTREAYQDCYHKVATALREEK